MRCSLKACLYGFESRRGLEDLYDTLVIMPMGSPEEQNKYQREWAQKRRQAWISNNGPCQQCGSSDLLEVDHIDPTTKDPKLKSGTGIWSWSQERRDTELIKCQVLCHDCHLKKSSSERVKNHGPTLYNNGCRCDICVVGKRAVWARYNNKQKQQSR